MSSSKRHFYQSATRVSRPGFKLGNASSEIHLQPDATARSSLLPRVNSRGDRLRRLATQRSDHPALDLHRDALLEEAYLDEEPQTFLGMNHLALQAGQR